MAAELGWYNACICCISPFEEEDIVDPFFLRQDRKFGRTGFFCQEVDGGSGGGGGGVQANAVSASAGDEKADEDEDEEALRNIIAVGQSRFELAGKEVPPQDDVEYFSERVINICGLNHGNMPKRTGMTLNGTNCYLVGTGKKRILIDTACGGPGPVENYAIFIENLAAVLEKEGCTIERILLTHSHSDHFGGCVDIQERWGPGIPIAMMDHGFEQLQFGPSFLEQMKERGIDKILDAGDARIVKNIQGNWWEKDVATLLTAPLDDWPDENDISWVENSESLNMGRGVSREYMAFHYLMSTAGGQQKIMAFRERWMDPDDDTMPAERIAEGDVIVTEGATFRAEYAPGHWENHCVFYMEEEHAIFSGDHVLGFGTTMLVDLYDYMATLRRMAAWKPTLLYPGHGPRIGQAGDDGYAIEFLERYAAHRQSREDQVVQLLEQMVPEDPFGPDDGTADGINVYAPPDTETAWSQPTTLLIAQTLYQNTATDRMQNACQNIEKIMMKLHLDGRAQAIDRVAGTTGQLEHWMPSTFKRYDVTRGPGSWLPETAAWKWYGEPRDLEEQAAAESKLQKEEAELAEMEAQVELKRAKVAAMRSQL